MSRSITKQPEPLRQAFTQAELTVILSNAAVVASKPAGSEPDGIPKRRLSALRKVATAMSETLKGLQDEGFLRAEEAVYAMVVLAVSYQVLYVNGSATVPKQVVSQATLDDVRALIGKRA